MNTPRHILICGDIGVGKSTLISRLLTHSDRQIYGFVTKREPADDKGVCSVYLHPASAQERVCTQANRVGNCNPDDMMLNTAAFDDIGVSLLKAEPSGILIMDELGFMESGADLFCAAVLNALDGGIPVIAAVKSRHTPFLDAVRKHPNVNEYCVTLENRDELYKKLKPLIQRL
ncbi:MAG: nucleoside-triphosphatase [Clostridia bacterium]